MLFSENIDSDFFVLTVDSRHCGTVDDLKPTPPPISSYTCKKEMSRNPKFSSPYSAFEEKGCDSAFPKLASWADPHGQTSLHDRLCPAVSDVASPTAAAPGMWEALGYFLNEQTSLNYAFVFVFSFL